MCQQCSDRRLDAIMRGEKADSLPSSTTVVDVAQKGRWFLQEAITTFAGCPKAKVRYLLVAWRQRTQNFKTLGGAQRAFGEALVIITTPAGKTYTINANGDISYPGMEPSGNWKMLGIVPVRGSLVISRIAITAAWLASHPLVRRNGNPRYTVVDLDHGVRRVWGNTKYHGIRSIVLE